MPRVLTRPEAIKRLAIRAVIDAIPGLSHQQVAAAFHASNRTVTLASHRTVEQWLATVRAAPAPSPPVQASPGPVIHAPAPEPVPVPPVRRGSRGHAKLVRPDPADLVDIPDLDANTELPEPQDLPEDRGDVDLPDVRDTSREAPRSRRRH